MEIVHLTLFLVLSRSDHVKYTCISASESIYLKTYYTVRKVPEKQSVPVD